MKKTTRKKQREERRGLALDLFTEVDRSVKAIRYIVKTRVGPAGASFLHDVKAIDAPDTVAAVAVAKTIVRKMYGPDAIIKIVDVEFDLEEERHVDKNGGASASLLPDSSKREIT